MAVTRPLRGAAAGHVLRLFSSSVMDQIVLSAANFVVGFILIRYTTDDTYGLYILVYMALLLATTIQRAGFTGPLTVVSARRSPEERRASVGGARELQRRWLLWLLPLSLCVPLAGWLLGLLDLEMALLVAVGLLGAWATLRREFLRSVLLLYARPDSLLAADAVYGTVLIATAALAAVSHNAAFWAVVALFVAALAGELAANRPLARDPGWVNGDIRPILREMRPLGLWWVVGALAYWLYSSASNYLLAGLVDIKAVADVNATRLLLMPVITIAVGVQALMTPTAALWYAQVGLARLTRRLLAFVIGLTVLDLAYVAMIWLGRDWLVGTVLHKHIDQRDELILLWAAVAVIGAIRDVMQSALNALGMAKSMASQAILCAVVSLGVTFIGVRWWGAAACLIAQIAGELINLAGIGLKLREAHRLPEPGRSRASAA